MALRIVGARVNQNASNKQSAKSGIKMSGGSHVGIIALLCNSPSNVCDVPSGELTWVENAWDLVPPIQRRWRGSARNSVAAACPSGTFNWDCGGWKTSSFARSFHVTSKLWGVLPRFSTRT